MKLYNQFIIWLTLMFLFINLNSYAEKSFEAIAPDKNSSETTRPGFRNIYLGMTRAEVRDRIKEEEIVISTLPIDKQIFFTSPRFAQTKVGPYPVDISLIYDNHEVLYWIGLRPPLVTADEIKTTLQGQIDFFYGVFQKKFGEPTHTRLSKGIDLFDFNFREYTDLYNWTKDNVTRYISLRTDGFKYGIAILIIDTRLAEIKTKEDMKEYEERMKMEQERVLDDF